MRTRIVEATNGFNWGKFLVGKFDEAEWALRSAIPQPEPMSSRPLLGLVGWHRKNLWVLDLQTGEGALFRPGGLPSADLDKHRVWVCPLYEPFLAWLYRHPEHWEDPETLPRLIEIEAEGAFYGYRRRGPG